MRPNKTIIRISLGSSRSKRKISSERSMKHRVPKPRSNRSIGKPKWYTQEPIGKPEPPSPKKIVQARTSRKNTKNKVNQLIDGRHELICGSCVLNLKEKVKKIQPQLSFENFSSTANCLVILRTVLDCIKGCPNSQLQHFSSNNGSNKENELTAYVRDYNPESPDPSKLPTELPILDHLPISEVLNSQGHV